MTVPKFTSKEEYEKWKAERLANPQPVQHAPSYPSVQSRPDEGDLEIPNKQIKQAWIAGVISGIVTLIVTVLAANGYDPLGLGYNYFSFIDVALIFALAAGIYFKSRTCALLMFLYFVGSKIFMWLEMGNLSGLPSALIFGYFFLMGIIGTFGYKSVMAGDASAAGWRPVAVTGAIILLIVVLFYGRNLGLNSDLSSLLPGQTAGAWKDFSPPDGSFIIAMPGDPVKKVQTTKTAAGDMDMHMFTLDLRSASYAVIYSDFPPVFLQSPNAAERLLDGGRDGAIAQVKGKLVNEQPVTIGRHPGRELQISFSGGTIVARIYIINSRLYQVLAVLPRGQSVSDETWKFLDSFRAVT